MSVLVDGYNLIGRGVALGLALSDEDKEKRLLDLLARYRDRKGMREPLVVVFDGQYGGLARRRTAFMHRGISVEYALGRSADDALIARVGKARRARDLTVVSSDRRVARECQLRGARTRTSEEFIEEVTAHLAGGEAEKPEGPRGSEVEDWLRYFSRGEGS